MTINNIKSACENHFSSVTESGLVCDVVAGDQGPSCRMLDQLPDTKVIHVRFIESELETIQDTSGSPSKRIKKHRIRLVVHRPKQTRWTNRKSTTRKAFQYPKC